jgi:hypothetical protein
MAKKDDIIEENGVEWVLFDSKNPHIMVNDKKNFKCNTCSKDFKSKTGAITHTSTTHSMNLDGTPSIKADPPSTTKNPPLDDTVSGLVMQINNTDDAKSASKITKDPELMYIFYMMKAHKLIDPAWSLHDFLRESAYFYADQNGIRWSFGQDLGIVSDGVRRNAEIIKERWEKWIEE